MGLQESSVQGFPSSQLTGVCTHWPVLGLNVSEVQALWSSQLGGGLTVQTPEWQVEFCPHGVPSGTVVFVQLALLALLKHVSVVQGLPSSQLNGVPLQTPP